MGGYVGKYSRSPFSVFNEEKNYPFALMQEGIPVTDDDENDSRIAGFTQMRRVVQLFGEYGSPNSGFGLLESITTNVNNFTVSTLAGPANADIEQAGQFFMRGIRCLLMHSVDYENTLVDLAEQSLHPRVTNNYWDDPNTVVEDSAANWVTDELAGRTVSIDGGSWLTIVSNTTNSFLIAGDQTGTIDNGDHYILRLTTPGGARTDEVYLNVYIDEYDSTDDPTLEKELGGNSVEAQLRAKIIQTIFVREDSPGVGSVSDYVDANGNQHFVSKISTLTRDANDTITQAEMTNSVLALGGDAVLSQIAPLEPSAQSPASALVAVVAGQALSTDGKSIVEWPGGTSPTFANTHATDDRIDMLILDATGSLVIIEGTPHPTTPVVPAFYGVPIAAVTIESTGGGAPVIVTGNIDDARTLFTPAHLGSMLRAEISGDNALSAVTVGESGCDFTTIDDAITYVGGLTRALDRQVAIYLFNKRNGQDWTLGAALVIPNFIHLIGVGRPTIKSTLAVAYPVVIGAESSLQDVRVQVDDSWTANAILLGADARCENVEVHYVGTSNRQWDFAYGLLSERAKIINCRLTSNSSWKCGAIEVDSAVDCHVEGGHYIGMIGMLIDNTVTGLMVSGATLDVTNVGIDLRDNDCQFRGINITGSGTIGMQARGNNCVYTDIDINSSLATFTSIEGSGWDSVFTNIDAPDGKVFCSGHRNRYVDCNFGYDEADTNPVINVGTADHIRFINCNIDRGGVNQAGIEATHIAGDSNSVIGCRIRDTDETPSILGFPGANDWILKDNIVDVEPNPNGATGWRIDERIRTIETIRRWMLLENPPLAGTGTGTLGYGNGVWIAGGATTTAGRSLDNGRTWTPITIGFTGSESVQDVEYNANTGTWLAVGGLGASAGRAFRSTDDGQNWTEITDVNTIFGTEAVLTLSHKPGSLTWIVGGNAGIGAYSFDDGQNFTVIGTTQFGSNQISGSWYQNGRFFFSGANGTGSYSTNATTWTAMTLGVGTTNMRAIAGDGYNKLVIVGNDNTGVYSDDNGATWNTSDLRGSLGTTDFICAAYSHGVFLAGGSSANIRYAVDDGQSWNSVDHAGIVSPDVIAEIATDGVRFLSVGGTDGQTTLFD